MRKKTVVLALVALMLLGLGGISPALADVAPPQNPPGASVSTGKYQTKVQMVSENVLMTIDDFTDTEKLPYRVEPFIRGQVDATFILQNQGETAEAFDVWFPLAANPDLSVYSTIKDFKAWIDGAPAAKIGQQETLNKDGIPIPWATWPVTFPPGKQVTLRVTYDTYGVGSAPYAQLKYVLATGAGWYGSIGKGTVTFRLPYDVNELNTVLTPGVLGWPQYDPPREPHTLSGTDVVWHFMNLEPTPADDVALAVLTPAVWRKIEAAQANVAANPQSVKAQLALADAVTEGLYDRGGGFLLEIGGSRKLFKMAADAYEAALRIEPDNQDIIIACATLLGKNGDLGNADLNARRTSMLDRALQIAPENLELQALKRGLSDRIFYATQNASQAPTQTAIVLNYSTQYAQLTATAVVAATAAEGVRLGIILPLTSTDTPLPPRTPTETATTTAAAASTPGSPPTPVSTPTAVPQAGLGSVQEWTPILLGVVIAAVVGWVWLRRRAK